MALQYNSYENSMYSRICQGLKDGMSVGTSFRDTVQGRTEGHWQLSDHHQYQIVGNETIDINGNEKKFICLFNPQGRNVIHYFVKEGKTLERKLVERGSEYEKCSSGLFMMELRDFLRLTAGIERYSN